MYGLRLTELHENSCQRHPAAKDRRNTGESLRGSVWLRDRGEEPIIGREVFRIRSINVAREHDYRLRIVLRRPAAGEGYYGIRMWHGRGR